MSKNYVNDKRINICIVMNNCFIAGVQDIIRMEVKKPYYFEVAELIGKTES